MVQCAEEVCMKIEVSSHLSAWAKAKVVTAGNMAAPSVVPSSPLGPMETETKTAPTPFTAPFPSFTCTVWILSDSVTRKLVQN
eukprot:3488273-Amphidinium_carterae.1